MNEYRFPSWITANTKRSSQYKNASYVCTPWQNSSYPLAERFAMRKFCQGYTHWQYGCYVWWRKAMLDHKTCAIAIFHLTLGMCIINLLIISTCFSQIINFFASHGSHESHKLRVASPALAGFAECLQPDGKCKCNDAFSVRFVRFLFETQLFVRGYSGTSALFLATSKSVWWRAYAWMVAYICVDGGEHMRGWTPTNTWKCSCKFKKGQALI